MQSNSKLRQLARSPDGILGRRGADHQTGGGQDPGARGNTDRLVHGLVNAEVIGRNDQESAHGLRSGARSREASASCHEMSAGTPHKTSRRRLAMETANASSPLTPNTCPNKTNIASCTPRPAGTKKARCRIACVMLSSRIAPRTSSGCPNSFMTNQVSNEAETNASNCSEPANKSVLPRDKQARSSRSSAAAPSANTLSPSIGRRNDSMRSNTEP